MWKIKSTDRLKFKKKKLLIRKYERIKLIEIYFSYSLLMYILDYFTIYEIIRDNLFFY